MSQLTQVTNAQCLKRNILQNMSVNVQQKRLKSLKSKAALSLNKMREDPKIDTTSFTKWKQIFALKFIRLRVCSKVCYSIFGERLIVNSAGHCFQTRSIKVGEEATLSFHSGQHHRQ